ncbi:hypothetical protein [Cyanobacterium aponinum]|uniref:Uncharacterized protein n=1 Tax=Cyanobacterium aponinum (strain PCC 10605) TaxID=755178 RepID=K9Z6D7_CYAAP|nr:hypothetical protein [Cyanobacterium aponinum]AFZ54140.1 hypothetical protein Cyan10605_2051 [Cyanobacterium aponinum PCC 10605]
MNIKYLEHKVRFLTNEKGQKTDVLIPLIVWEKLISLLNEKLSENSNTKAELIAELKQSLLDAQEGKTFPLEELWEGIE